MFGIIDHDAQNKIVIDAQKLFYRARVHTLILSPDLAPLAHPYPIRGLIILRPEQFTDLEGLVARVRAAYPDIPLVLFLRKDDTDGNLYVYRRLSDFVYDDGVGVDKVTHDLLSAYEAKGGKGENKIAHGLYISRDREYATIFGLPVPYTKVELMLLYYLLLIYPRAASRDELCSVCFQPGHTVSEHNLISRISEINCKTKESFPALRLIERTKENEYHLPV